MTINPGRPSSSRSRSIRRRHRRLTVGAFAFAALILGALITTASGTDRTSECSVTYQVVNQKDGDFLAHVSLTNQGKPVLGWTVNWATPPDQRVRRTWNAEVIIEDGRATATNMARNGSLSTHETVVFAFQSSTDQAATVPRSFTFNGQTCNKTVNATTTSPTASPSTTDSPTGQPTTSSPTTGSPTTTSAPSSSTTSSSAPVKTSGLTSVESQVFDRVNAQRMENGCKALVIESHLQKAAHDYAVEMVETHTFSHTSASGLDATARARAAGFDGRVGENIAMGYVTDAAAVVQGWMDSPGHRANILNCSYTKTGVGHDFGQIKSGYSPGSWVQDFAF